MTIEVRTKLIVGYRFSDLCVVDRETNSVSFCSPGLEEEVLKRFEGGEIDVEEVTPEFISLIMDLDCVEFANQQDGIIGKELDTIGVGESGVCVRDLHIIDMAQAEIKSKVETIDPEIIDIANIKISMIGEVKLG